MARPTFKQFREKALRKPGVKAEYDALAPVGMKAAHVALRQAAGLPQVLMAAKLGTRKSSSSAR
jgi:hypothetical protein